MGIVRSFIYIGKRNLTKYMSAKIRRLENRNKRFFLGEVK